MRTPARLKTPLQARIPKTYIKLEEIFRLISPFRGV